MANSTAKSTKEAIKKTKTSKPPSDSSRRRAASPSLRYIGPSFPSEPVLVPLQAAASNASCRRHEGRRGQARESGAASPQGEQDRSLSRATTNPRRARAGRFLYIIDHHHLSLALWQTQVDHAYVEIVDDLSRLTRERFWARMEDEGRLHPFDEAGRRIDPARLPSRLTGLRNDPYRDLAWSVREYGGFEKNEAPYSEFFWASFFRSRIALGAVRSDYDWAVCAGDQACQDGRGCNAAGVQRQVTAPAAIAPLCPASPADARTGASTRCRRGQPEPRRSPSRAISAPRACRRSSSPCRCRACC